MESIAFKDKPYIKIGDKWWIKINQLYLGSGFIRCTFKFNSDRIYKVKEIKVPEKISDGVSNSNGDIFIYLSNGIMDVALPYKYFEKLFTEVPEDDGRDKE